jgi:hypothetical protein
MPSESQVLDALAPYAARRINVSRRGSGLNATWHLQLPNGHPAILKTYALRRSPAKTALLRLAHRVEGRTSYSAASRQATERTNLLAWREAGFAVPSVLDFPPPGARRLPLPSLCMEFVEGPLLSDVLADPKRSAAEKDAIYRRFVAEWGRRHEAAMQTSNRRLIQEHGSFEHVIVTDSGFVTFDLEVSYTALRSMENVVSSEICGYLRSLFRKTDPHTARHFVQLTAACYPRPDYLETVFVRLFHHPSIPGRLAGILDRNLVRDPRKADKHEIARLLHDALQRLTPSPRP